MKSCQKGCCLRTIRAEEARVKACAVYTDAQVLQFVTTCPALRDQVYIFLVPGLLKLPPWRIIFALILSN